MIHGEQPSVAALGGGALIVSAALAGTWWQGRVANSASL
jgi:hypothetical protein